MIAHNSNVEGFISACSDRWQKLLCNQEIIDAFLALDVSAETSVSMHFLHWVLQIALTAEAGHAPRCVTQSFIEVTTHHY